MLVTKSGLDRLSVQKDVIWFFQFAPWNRGNEIDKNRRVRVKDQTVRTGSILTRFWTPERSVSVGLDGEGLWLEFSCTLFNLLTYFAVTYLIENIK